MTPSVCPSVEDLKQFRLGRSPAADTPLLEQHLRNCPACAGRLSATPAEDPLVLGLRAQRGRPRLRNPLLERVRQETRAVALSSAEQPTPAIGSTRPPLGGGSRPEEATRAAPAGSFEAIQQTYFFLAPPKGPDEMGWLGFYRVLRVLGEGGMGVVLQAEDTRLQRRVALKVMKPLLAADPAARQRFHREARATAALEHDNIIAIHAIDEANGVPYLAMPLLQGETLDTRLKRESMLSLGEVLRIGRETAEGLAAAHAKGLIHRDVKPSNIWLEAPASRVKILDFGLAAMPVPEGEKTLPGTLLGTPGYMAPEQTEGEADARADLFSLGCVLYRMATGQAPFPGQTPMQKIRSTLFETPRPPQEINPALPGALCHLILRLLARQPKDRPATALAVARVLETIEGQSGPGRPPVAQLVPPTSPLSGPTVPVAALAPAPPLPPPPALDKRWLLLGGGMMAALFLLVLLLTWPSRKRTDKGRPDDHDGDKLKEFSGFARPSAQGRLRPAGLGSPAEEEVVPDRTFTETWVTRPQPIDGLSSWGIVSDGVGKYVPLRFEFTADERLLILYRFFVPMTNMTSSLWYQFDPSTCGLELAPFGGSYLDLARNARLCARAGEGGVQLWEEGSPSERITLRIPGPSYDAAFSPDAGKIATFDLGPQTWSWHVREGPFPWWFPEGLTSTTHAAWFWHVSEGSKLGRCAVPDLVLLPTVRGWSPDNKTLAVGSQTGVALFRAPWKEAKVIRRPLGVTALAWSPDAKLLATVGQDRRVHLLDERGQVAEQTGLPLAATSSFVPAWSPDGRELTVATEEGKVVVWDRKAKRVTYRFAGHTRPISLVAFMGDGRTLVSASTGSVRFWDLKKAGGDLRGALLNFGDKEWLAISPEGYFRGAEGRFKFKVRDEKNVLREFSYEQFRSLYAWKNHPERVKLSGD